MRFCSRSCCYKKSTFVCNSWGVSANVIKYRFSDEIIQELLKLDYNKLDESMIREHINELYYNVNELKNISWLPRKK